MVHYNELDKVSTKTGHSVNQVIHALQSLSLTTNNGLVSFTSFLTVNITLNKLIMKGRRKFI